MKKLFKLTLIFFVLLMLCVTTPVLAANTTENTNSNKTNTATNTTTNTTQNVVNNDSDSKSSTKVTSVASLEDGELSFSDILNILLIATGVIIIFLAIAIIIRLK